MQKLWGFPDRGQALYKHSTHCKRTLRSYHGHVLKRMCWYLILDIKFTIFLLTRTRRPGSLGFRCIAYVQLWDLSFSDKQGQTLSICKVAQVMKRLILSTMSGLFTIIGNVCILHRNYWRKRQVQSGGDRSYVEDAFEESLSPTNRGCSVSDCQMVVELYTPGRFLGKPQNMLCLTYSFVLKQCPTL